MSIHDQSNISLLINVLENEFSRKAVVRSSFVDFFNNRLEMYHQKRFNYHNLQEMNKHLLSDCFQFINKENKQIEKNTMVLKPPPSSHTFQSPTDNIRQQQKNNDNAFDSYKKQYDTMLNPKKPSEIDFSDTIEDEPIQNIDSIMNQTLEDRAKELARITNTYSDKPPDWIKPPENKQTPDNQPMKLIIEDKPTKSTQSILKQKKVSFDFSEQPTDNSSVKPHESITVNKLLNKLKIKQKQQPQQNDIQSSTILNSTTTYDSSSHSPSSSSSLSLSPSLQINNQQLIDIEKRIYDKIETQVEAKFSILNEKYDKLQIQYEELAMKYGELIMSPPKHKQTEKMDLN